MYSGRDRQLPSDYSQGLRGLRMHLRSMGVYIVHILLLALPVFIVAACI